MQPRSLSDLAPDEFENLVFDLVMQAGLRNVIWRTPGADGGRDIEGDYISSDLSGDYSIQRWYIECKRYQVSIDWPTVWQKIAYADSNGAAFLLLATNSNPSPACETQIAKWNSERRYPQVRVWRGYKINQILRMYAGVALKYGLRSSSGNHDVDILPLMMEVMKASQSSYSALEFSGDALPGLEAASSNSELVSLRLDQIRRIGWISSTYDANTPPDYPWLIWNGNFGPWDTAGLRALLSSYRYYLVASAVTVTSVPGKATLFPASVRALLTSTTRAALITVATWANIEIEKIDDEDQSMVIRSRAPLEDDA